MSDFADLLAVLEELRVKRFPDLDKELVAGIATAEFNWADDRTRAVREVRSLLERSLRPGE